MSCFITGATGFIGRYLVRELLARGGDGSVFVLVRGASQQKLAELKQWWGAGADSVIAIDGDLSAANMGVSAADRDWLRGRVTHFFHLAALYDLDASAEACVPQEDKAAVDITIPVQSYLRADPDLIGAIRN